MKTTTIKTTDGVLLEIETRKPLSQIAKDQMERLESRQVYHCPEIMGFRVLED